MLRMMKSSFKLFVGKAFKKLPTFGEFLSAFSSQVLQAYESCPEAQPIWLHHKA
jgi:hypothetical protein